jgi:hypothetical protein
MTLKISSLEKSRRFTVNIIYGMSVLSKMKVMKSEDESDEEDKMKMMKSEDESDEEAKMKVMKKRR